MTDATTQAAFSNELARICNGGDPPTTTAEASVTLLATGQVRAGFVNAGGSGYVVGDILTTNITAGTEATFTVTKVGGGGVVKAISLTTPGDTIGGDETGSAVTGGSGAGCTLDIVAEFGIDTLTIDTDGAGYEYEARVYTNGTGGERVPATFTVTVDVDDTIEQAGGDITVDTPGWYLTAPTLTIVPAEPADAAAIEAALEAYDNNNQDARIKALLEDAFKTENLNPDAIVKVTTYYNSL